MTNRTDNFNRADTTNNIGTPSDGGSAWVQQLGTWGINTNLGYESAATAKSSAVLESSVANVTVQVTFTTVVAHSALVARATDANNLLVLYGSAGLIRLFKYVAGSLMLLSSNAGFQFVSGDAAKITADSANLITGYQNGNSRVSATDSFNSTATLHGLMSDADNAGRYDDFSITALGGAAQTPWAHRFSRVGGVGPHVS